MDSVPNYARQWARGEKGDIHVKSLMQIRIWKFSGSMNTHTTLIFKEANVANHLSDLHEVYDVVLAESPLAISFSCVNHITQTVW